MILKDLTDFRKSYDKSSLIEKHCPNNPIILFNDWFDQANNCEQIVEANSMSLSTIGLDGYPKSRVILLKKVDEKGFVFYTNYNSEKGKALDINSKVCVSFFWDVLERQVVVKGTASRTTSQDSDEYFFTRPRGSQLGAWASEQSSVVPSREFIEQRFEQVAEEFESKELQRPLHWGGYVIDPFSIEFWQGRPNRFHDRIRYTKNNGNWMIERLAP